MPHWEHRFWEKVDVRGEDECWEWQASHDRWAYGHFWLDGTMQAAHRLVWELTNGPIPQGLCVLHHCDHPGCQNPSHLFLGTIADNNRDMREKGRARSGRLRGQKNGQTKLTRQEVHMIRQLYATGKHTQALLGERFGIAQRTVSHIVRRERWAWLDASPMVRSDAMR